MLKYVVALVCVATIALPSARAGTCADPKWAAKRYPGYELKDCATKAWAAVPLELASGTKTVGGEVTTYQYEQTEGQPDQPAQKVVDYYKTAGMKAGAKVIS